MKLLVSLTILIVGWVSAGCSDNVATGCVSDSECRFGRVCANSVCSQPEPDEPESPDNQAPDTTSRGGGIEAGPFAEFILTDEGVPLVGAASCECTSFNNAYQVILYLRHDGRADAFYEEGFFGHGFNATSGRPDEPETRVRFDDRWRVDEDALTVGDWLTCSHRPSTSDQHPSSIDCMVKRDMQNARAESFLRFGPDDGYALPTHPNDASYDAYAPLE